MPQTIRKYWGAFRGRTTFNYNWPAIDQDSVVAVTASEYNNEGVRFIGAGSITVANIAPHGPPYDPNHGVTFVVNVDWGSPLNVVTDITLFDNKPTETQIYIPPTPNNIGLRMQYQETNEWCWIAVATSINHFYNPRSTWTQCAVMTVVGQTINLFPPNTSACPSAQVLAANPGLSAILADPYSKPAEFVLDNPAYGIDRQYIKSGGVSDPLKVTGNFASNQPNSLRLDQIASEINAGRPVIANITWFAGESHCVAIAGVLGDSLLILDPANGQSVARFGTFPTSYFGGAKLDEYTFTKA
ncbi:MAG: C39 family peptidase [Verrucomicrobia bacterium]|nr:C39 family peptidase [Verrucomicrobiota bacterium]MBV8277171.1 C39 family peptidase [Verrucomicrobiota bacterium]